MKNHLRIAAITCVLAAAATTRADAGPASLLFDFADPSGWTEYNHDLVGSRDNTAEKTLSPSTVSGLHVKWQYPTAAGVNALPVVADGVVYAGDNAGVVYALSTTGTLIWKTQVKSAVTGSATIVGPLLTVGDLAGNIYGIRRDNGQIVWATVPNSGPLPAVYGSGLRLGPFVAYGIASNEEDAAANPAYPCCHFRGSVVLLNALTGAIQWQTSLITDAEAAAGSSGAGVWSTPSLDPLTLTLYVTTGNNYTAPDSAYSDAVLALDVITGKIKWVNKRTPNDTWNARYPLDPKHQDADFGDSPQIYNLPSGHRVVGAGQKTGFYEVFDAITGALVNQVQVEPAGGYGGLTADSAYANGVVYANGINWPGLANDPSTAVAGDLIAIAGDGSHELWRFTTPKSPDIGGVAVANGVVYFVSSFAGQLFALDAASGTPLAAVPVGLGITSPSVANGQVYVGTGLSIGGFNYPGAISALGL